MDMHLGWSTARNARVATRILQDSDREVERSYFAGLAAFIAIWTFMLAALMAAAISDNIKPAEQDIDIAAIEPPVPSYTPVPEAPAPVYSLPAIDAAAPPVWTPPADEPAGVAEAETAGEDQITVERNPQTNMPTKITIIGRAERVDPPTVVTIEPANRSEPARPAPPARNPTAPVTAVPPAAPVVASPDAATRVIDDIF